MKMILAIALLIVNSSFAKDKSQANDPWGIKKVDQNKIFFNNPSIDPVPLELGPGSEGGFTTQVVGEMSDSSGIPTIIYLTTSTESSWSDMAITRPLVDPKSRYKVQKWEFALSGIPLPGNYYSNE